MPKFIEDIYTAFRQVILDAEGMWAGTPLTTRLVLALVMAGLGSISVRGRNIRG